MCYNVCSYKTNMKWLVQFAKILQRFRIIFGYHQTILNNLSSWGYYPVMFCTRLILQAKPNHCRSLQKMIKISAYLKYICIWLYSYLFHFYKVVWEPDTMRWERGHILAEQSGMTTDHPQLLLQFQTHPWHCGTHTVKWCGGLWHHEPRTNA